MFYVLTFLIAITSTEPQPAKSCDIINYWFRYSTTDPPPPAYNFVVASRTFSNYDALDFVLRHERFVGAEVWSVDQAGKPGHFRVDQYLKLDSLTREVYGYGAILTEIPLEE